MGMNYFYELKLLYFVRKKVTAQSYKRHKTHTGIRSIMQFISHSTQFVWLQNGVNDE